MNTFIRKAMPVVLSLTCFSVPTGVFAQSEYHQVHRYYSHSHTVHGYMAAHPKVRAATIGAGVGTAAGAITGLVTGRGILRGAVIGAGTGAGVGLVRSSEIMYRHPIVKDTATGSLVGLGLGLAGGRHHGTAARTTAVGAAAGLGTGLLIHGL